MRLVATLSVDRPWYAEHTVPFMRHYAERIDADFMEFRSFQTPRHYGPATAWLRLEAIRAFAGDTRYDALLLLDADVLVLPGCPDLFDRLGERVLAVQDMGLPKVSARYIDWCVRYFAERPNHDRYFNAGVLAMTRRMTIELLPSLDGPYPDERYFEQDYLNLRIQNRFGIEFLPEEFNWLAPQFPELALTKHMVHFVGTHKQLLPEFLARLGPNDRPVD